MVYDPVMAVTGQRLCDLFICAAQDIIARAELNEVLVPGVNSYYSCNEHTWKPLEGVNIKDVDGGRVVLAGRIFNTVVSPKRQINYGYHYPIGHVSFEPAQTNAMSGRSRHDGIITFRNLEVAFDVMGGPHMRASYYIQSKNGAMDLRFMGQDELLSSLRL